MSIVSFNQANSAHRLFINDVVNMHPSKFVSSGVVEFKDTYGIVAYVKKGQDTKNLPREIEGVRITYKEIIK